jgi:hypothetical protein
MKKVVWISGAIADEEGGDFGVRVQRELNERAETLLGAESLSRSALGPFTGADSTQAIVVARGLRVSPW